jgi:NADPH-dependent 2,4-dienoyl-CoA reductase/sulfur reductase-like enzyme
MSQEPAHTKQSRKVTLIGADLPPVRRLRPRGLVWSTAFALVVVVLLVALGQGWVWPRHVDAVWLGLIGVATVVTGVAWTAWSTSARRRDAGLQAKAKGADAAQTSAMGRPSVVDPGGRARRIQTGGNGNSISSGTPSKSASSEPALARLVAAMSPRLSAEAFNAPDDNDSAPPDKGVAAANTVAADLDAPIERAVPRPVQAATMTRVGTGGPEANELHADHTTREATSSTTRAGSNAERAASRAKSVDRAAPSAWTPGRRLLARTRPSGDPSVRRVVIVGNGIAGLTAAETTRELHPTCEIHLIGRERQASYLRTGVTSLISQRSQLQDLALRPDVWYAEQRIHCWLNTRAVALDTHHQLLTLASLEELRYDRLILATGAIAWLPPTVDGFGVPGSFVLRSAADALTLRAFVQRYGARRAVVLGAGLLGIETADTLHQMGLAVHLLAQGEQVLEHRLDRDAAALVAAQLRHIGIKLSTHAQLRSLHRSGSDRLARVRLTSGQVIEAELLVVCTGARPDITLPEVAGIAVDRGVLVDDHLRSSAAGVYACGDVAQTSSPLLGLWTPAAEQGRVAALNALGLPTRYEQQVPVVALKLTGLKVRSAGQLHAEGPGQIELCHRPPTAANRAAPPDAPPTPALPLANFHTPERYTKVVVEIDSKRREHVLGAIVVGDDPGGDDILAAACARAPSSSLGAALMQRPWQRQRGELIEPRPHKLTPSRTLPHDERVGVDDEPARKPRRVA